MAVQKHRSKPYQKPGAEIVRQDVKWNGQTRSYISEIIKIKLSDLNFLRIDDLRICDECLYFMGTKFK